MTDPTGPSPDPPAAQTPPAQTPPAQTPPAGPAATDQPVDGPTAESDALPPRYSLPGSPPPTPGQTGYGPPGYGPPGYGPPGYGPPGYGQPGYGQPGYGPPYGPPGYGPPGYGPPGYGPPRSGPPPPGYGPPGWYGYGPPAQPKAGSAATGPLPLHPMTVGDVLDGIFKLLKANFRTIAVIVGVLVIPFHVLLAFLSRDTFGGASILRAFNDPSVAQSSNNSATTQLLRYGVYLIDIVLLPFVGGAIATVVAASYLGRELGPADALRATGRRFRSLLGAWFTVHPLEAIGLVFCVLPGLCLMTLSLMIAPAIVTEDLSFFKGVRRSWNLASRRFWPVLWTMVLTGVIAYFIGVALGGVPDFLAFAIGLRWGWLLLALGQSLTALIVTPIAAITATLLYFDARIRTEGFDLQVIAAGLARSGA